jgi:UDP-galactopyranose mutase
MYDYLIVGAGLFGSIFAYEANKSGKKVLVVEKRKHIGGNCYSEPFEDYHIHKYGPHIFHTNKKHVWNYINQFASFNNFSLRNKAFVDNKIYSLPINLSTIHQIWPDITTPYQASIKIKQECLLIENPSNFEEYCLSTMGRTLYEMFFYGYTKKQWGREPKTLPASIAKRIPLRFSFNDRYYPDDHIYEGIPIDGYTSIFDKLLNQIDLYTECDYLSDKENLNKLAKKIIYTGPIDRYFNYMFGSLEYRTLKHSDYILETDIQGTALVTYPSEDFHFTRVIQHKYFTNSTSNINFVSYEYSKAYDKNIPNEDPYYPINDEINNNIYKKYKDYAEKNCPELIIGGRLGDYKYYDMDVTIDAVLKLVEKELAGK